MAKGKETPTGEKEQQGRGGGVSLKRETEPVAITGINIILTGSKLELDRLTSPDAKRDRSDRHVRR